MRLAIMFLAAIWATMALAGATETRIIGWRDLVPAAEPLQNPFETLSEDVRGDIATIARIRADLQLGFITEDSADMQEARALEQALSAIGVDANAVMAQADALAAEIDRRNSELVSELDGKIVRMPGYALPLEMSTDGVSEFLLVPYVGACIHAPPPPANQTVFVDLEGSYRITDLYAPVWVTGTIRTRPGTRALNFVDGEANVETGYTIEGLTVEPYR